MDFRGIERRYTQKQRVLIVCRDIHSGMYIAEKLHLYMNNQFTVDRIMQDMEFKGCGDALSTSDVVVISGKVRNKEEIINLSLQNRKEVLLIPDMFELFLFGSQTQKIGDLMIIPITPFEIKRIDQQCKRIFDMIVASLLFIFLSPVMLLLYVLIPLTSPGPAIFKQERLGLEGRPFYIYKFRSMIANAEQETGPVLAAEKDARITTIGNFIRATRLDELPQLWNVLIGDMSLVGPRPERAFFIKKFKEELPNYAYRMSVRPGITGLAQVMADYNSKVEDKLRFDLMYVRNYSFFLDLKILFQTVFVIFQRKKAMGIKNEEMG